METLRLGFIGAGFVAKFHAMALQMVRGVDLVGIYKRRGAEELVASATQKGLGDCKVYDTVAELCKNCDAVAVLAPNFVRVELVEQIVEAVKGEPVLPGFKGTCETCPYSCIFAGEKVEDLPDWLTD